MSAAYPPLFARHYLRGRGTIAGGTERRAGRLRAQREKSPGTALARARPCSACTASTSQSSHHLSRSHPCCDDRGCNEDLCCRYAWQLPACDGTTSATRRGFLAKKCVW